MDKLLYYGYLAVSPKSWLKLLGKLAQIISATILTPLWVVWWVPMVMTQSELPGHKNHHYRRGRGACNIPVPWMVSAWWTKNIKYFIKLLLIPLYIVDFILSPIRKRVRKALVDRGINPDNGIRISAEPEKGLCSFTKGELNGTHTRDSYPS